MRISRPVRSHFSPLPQTEDDVGTTGSKHGLVGSTTDSPTLDKDDDSFRRKTDSESSKTSLGIPEPPSGGDNSKTSKVEKTNEPRNSKIISAEKLCDSNAGKEGSPKTDKGSLSRETSDPDNTRHSQTRHRKDGGSNRGHTKDYPYLLTSLSSPSGGRRGSCGTPDEEESSGFLSILNSSSFKMKRKSFGTESEKRRGERFQREREMAYGAMGRSLDNHYEDDGDDDDDDDCDEDESDDDDDVDDDDDTSSESGSHVCDFSCPLIIHGQCPNATKRSGGARKRLRARRRSSFSSTSQLTTLLDTGGAVGGQHGSLLGSSVAARRLHPLISISIDDLTGALRGGGGGQGHNPDPAQPHQWERNRTLRRRALGAVTRRPALIPTSGHLAKLGDRGGGHHHSHHNHHHQQQTPSSRHHRHNKPHGSDQASPRHRGQHRSNHHDRHAASAAEKTSVSSAASVSTPGTPANSASAGKGDTRKPTRISNAKPQGTVGASSAQSGVHAVETEVDDSHHVTTSEQAGTQCGSGQGGEESCSGAGNGSVKLAGEGGPITVTEQDSQQTPPEQEDKSRSSDSQSLTPSEDSDGDAKSDARSGRSHRLGSFLSIGSKSTDPFSDDIHDQFVGVGHCRFKAPRCFKHMRFPSTLEPHSKIYVSWLFLVTLAFMYNAVVIPLRGVFPYQTAENVRYWLAADYVCDFVYLLDIVVFKSRLRFINNGIDECARTETRKRYMEKWSFKLDIISLAPLDLLYFLKSVGVNPWLRLPRILKIQSYWEFYERCDEASRSAAHAIRIIKTMTYMLFLIHIETCGYYAVSSYEGIASNHWVYQGHGIAYIRCFYLATKTATSIGNNPKPTNELEYIFMTLYWLSGVFVFALLIGQIRDIVEAAGNVKDNYRKKMDSCHWYMQSINLPQELKDRVRQWFLYNWDQQKTIGKHTDERSLVSSLPKKLQADLAINVHFNTLSKVRLFQDCERNLLYDLVLKLKPILFLPGDYICRKGEVGKEMYIVTQGEVEVLGGEHNDTVLATLKEGSVFGEISLLAMSGGGNRRTADVRCKGYTNVFTLSKHDFQLAMMEYPEAQAVLKKRAKKLLKLNARLERRFKKSKAVESVSGKHYQETEELVQETSLVASTLIQVTDPDQNVVQQLSTSNSNNFFDIQPRIMTRSHSQRLNSPGPSLANRLTPSRSRSYREGLALSALTFEKSMSGGLARGYSSASLKVRSTSNKHLDESDEDSSGPMADDPFDDLSLSEMLHGSSASSSFEDDTEEVEGDKVDGESSSDKSLKANEKQNLIRPPSFKVNLKNFCRSKHSEEYQERVLPKTSPTQVKSPVCDGYRPSCLATSKGNNRGAICGQSIVDGGTRADFFHVDAMGASFLGEFYLDNVRPNTKGFSQKSVSFSDGSKTSYSDSYNNNNCNSSCQSSLLPKNKVHPATDLLPASSDSVSSPNDDSHNLPDPLGPRDYRKTPRTGCDPSRSNKPRPKDTNDLPTKDFNDVFEVFHDSQSDLTCCSLVADPQPNLPQQPSALINKSSSLKSKKEFKGNEIQKYVQKEKAGEARYLARVLPPEVFLATASRNKDDGKNTAQTKVVRNRLTAVSLDAETSTSLNSPELPGHMDKIKNFQSFDKEVLKENKNLTTRSLNCRQTLDAAEADKTLKPLDDRGKPHVKSGKDQTECDLSQASHLLQMLTPCTSTALLATGLEMAGCGRYGATTTYQYPPLPSPKISLSSSSTSPASSSSSPSRPCTSFFPSIPVCSNGSPPSLNLSAASSPRSSFSSTISPMKMSNLSFSYPSAMSSTSEDVTELPVPDTEKVSQITAPLGTEVPCEKPAKLSTLETVSPNRSNSPKLAFKVSPLRYSTPSDSCIDGPFPKPSFQSPLSNGLTNCCDRSAQQLTSASINKRVMFVPDMNTSKGVSNPATDAHSTRQNPCLSSFSDQNHKAAADIPIHSRIAISNSISPIAGVKTANQTDKDLYRQKETSL